MVDENHQRQPLPNPFPLTVKLPGEDEPMTFDTPANVQTWIGNEQNAWAPVIGVGGSDTAFVTSQWQALQIIQSSNFGDAASVAMRVATALRDNLFLSAFSPRGRSILMLARSNPQAAAVALGHFLRPAEQGWRNDANFFVGKMAAIAFDTISSTETDLVRTIVRADASVADMERSKHEVTRILEDAKARIDGVISKVSLGAPTTFWKARAERHRKLGRIMWLVWANLVAAAAVGAGLLGISLFELPSSSTAVAPGKAAATEVATRGILDLGTLLPRIAIFGVVVGLVVWLLRQILRVAMSHQHLREDADERATMVETYSAMLGAGLTGADFSPILSTLFRPAATGLAADEGPVLPIEVVTKQLGSVLKPGGER